eukprot:296252-Pyramimonas_sp.AAC.2
MQLQQRLAGAEAAIKGRHTPGRQSMLREEVTEADISEVISKWTGIPVQALLESEREKLLKLEDVLHARVIGQVCSQGRTDRTRDARVYPHDGPIRRRKR